MDGSFSVPKAETATARGKNHFTCYVRRDVLYCSSRWKMPRLEGLVGREAGSEILVGGLRICGNLLSTRREH